MQNEDKIYKLTSIHPSQNKHKISTKYELIKIMRGNINAAVRIQLRLLLQINKTLSK